MFGNPFFGRYYGDTYFGPGVGSDVDPEPDPTPDVAALEGMLRPRVIRLSHSPRIRVRLI